VNSFHVPGFSSGYVYEETRLLDLLRKEAYAISGLPVPPVEKPAPAPVLLKEGEGFTWRGSAGAASYTMERAESRGGPFRVIAVGLEDAVISDVAKFENSPEAASPLVLYYDENTKPGKIYYYRIKGQNSAGESNYSEVLEVRQKNNR
jgi:hypothetical protein